MQDNPGETVQDPEVEAGSEDRIIEAEVSQGTIIADMMKENVQDDQLQDLDMLKGTNLPREDYNLI